MYLTKEVKESIFEKHGKGKNDTGSIRRSNRVIYAQN